MWTPVANMNGRRLQFGVAVLDDKLYVVGGRDGLKTLNTVECYNPKTKTWSVMPPMSTHRHGLGVYNFFIARFFSSCAIINPFQVNISEMSLVMLDTLCIICRLAEILFAYVASYKAEDIISWDIF